MHVEQALSRTTLPAKNWIGRLKLNRQLRSFRKTVGRSLRPGVELKLLRLRHGVGFADKRVLEIGGDLDAKVARACLALGAKHVTSINHDSRFRPRSDERSRFMRMDATRLDLPADHFDLVLGFAVLEHVRGPERMLDGIRRVARPGAHVYLHGGPLWNSRKGHHVVAKGPSGKEWRFDGRPGTSNPLEDWEHLRREPPELRDRLVEKGCPTGDADAIVDSVFDSDYINRYPVAHIKRCFAASGFATLECIESKHGRESDGMLAELSRRHAMPESEFETDSIEFLLRK